MAISYNPSIVRSGLVLCLDAGNTKSYPGSGTTWTDLSGGGNNATLANGVGYTSTDGGSLGIQGTVGVSTDITNIGLATVSASSYTFSSSDVNKFVGLTTGGGTIPLVPES